MKIAEGGIYREEFVYKRAEFFKKWLSITTAMTIYKYFVGFEYADIDKINYEDTEHAKMQDRDDREFLVIHVNSMNPSAGGGITSETITKYDFHGFQKWFLSINELAGK